MEKWEYKQITWIGGQIRIDGNQVNSSVPFVTHLNQLGEQGWELVSVVSEAISICIGGIAGREEKRGGLYYYFKRSKL